MKSFHITSSESNEWYTPSHIIELARQAMGSIDTDPASHPVAQKTVKALRYFTIAEDGLAQDWTGNVWLNPPYGSGKDAWIDKFIGSYESGIMTQGILLINATPATNWFQPLWQYPICFTRKRIKFVSIEGKPSSPTYGNALVYVGNDVLNFATVFSAIGVTVLSLNESFAE